MALTKPILNSVVAWDADVGQTFTFNVIGGDLVTGNTITITTAGTSPITITETTYSYRAIVPAGTLTNGKAYTAYVTTTDANHNVSPQSNTISFYCFKTPTFAFDNLPSSTTINTSYITAQVDYSQINGEALSDYTYHLYDGSKLELANSGVIYTGEADTLGTAISNSYTYTFRGLEDNIGYYIQVTGHTTQGTIVTTGEIQFNVHYTTPEEYNLLFLRNNCNDGYITYYSMAHSIVGTSNTTPTYIDNQAIDLTNSNNYVLWNSNFILGNKWAVKAWVVEPNDDSRLITLTDIENNTIIIEYITDPSDNTKAIITVNVDNGYFIYSNSVTKPNSTQVLCFQVTRIDSFYDVVTEVV